MNIVLIHGAFHDGRAWDRVVAHLKDRGVANVWAPTIPGHGPHVPRNLSHDQMVAGLVDFITQHDLDDVVLVGHSFGGSIIMAVAQEVSERVAATIFANAVVPVHGQELIDLNADTSRLQHMFVFHEDGSWSPTYQTWRAAFIQDSTEAVAALAFAELTPEGPGSLTWRADVQRFFDLRLPAGYIHMTDDTLFAWKEFWERLHEPKVVEIPGSHEVMYSAPERMADAILEAIPDGLKASLLSAA
ncbi:alpha/beta hydrolase [Rugosimonospora acidiphila]|uniref:Alpha/beta hydrolase n=1 Tax=Rugosimonospora acidiphila TaxID=556531 RepID=A0ABP9RYL4_9ACTN